MQRKGLTLVEMLVALALTMFLMAILSEAFVTGLQAFRRLKAVGDMDQQLRTISNVLRRDLRADHFEGKRRLSSYKLNEKIDGKYDRPNLGYFFIREGYITSRDTIGNSPLRYTCFYEGKDVLERPSVRDRPYPASLTSPDPDRAYNSNLNPDLGFSDPGDLLAFTARLPGDRPEHIFFGSVPRRSALRIDATRFPPDDVGYPSGRFDAISNGLFSSQWAEIAYFVEPDLRPDGSVRTAYDEANNSALPLFKLYRVQLLLVPDPDQVEEYAAWDDGSVITPIEDAVPWQNYYAGNVNRPTEYKHDVSAYAEVQANGRWRYRYNSPADVQFPDKRFFSSPNNWAARRVARAGTDLLAVNVLSWDIKVYDPQALVRPIRPDQFKFRPEFVDLGQNVLRLDPPPGWFWNGPNSPAPREFQSQILDPLRGYTFDTLGNRSQDFRRVNPHNGQLETVTRDLGAEPAPRSRPLEAIQIRIRLWDEKTRQTREITIVQDL